MIIRSQDKKIIVNFNNIDTVDVRDKQVRYFANGGPETVGILGTYSTEEKAIKVLDIIQKFYAVYELAKVGRKVPNNEVTEFDNMIFGCFEMPQDSEV